MIALGEVTPAVPEELIREVVVADDQLRFMSSVEGRSPAADAPEANPNPVGFVMIAWEVDPGDGLIGPGSCGKLDIDRDHQRAAATAGRWSTPSSGSWARTAGTELFMSYVDALGAPRDFYARLGFVPRVGTTTARCSSSARL